MKMTHKKGFTLSEVMVVVIIIGVIVGLSFPRFTVAVERMRSSEGVDILTALLASQRRFALENGGAFRDGTGGGNALANGDLDIDIPASPNFDVPLISNNAAQVARIDRSSGEYFITIDSLGNLTCTDTGTGICPKMGL